MGFGRIACANKPQGISYGTMGTCFQSYLFDYNLESEKGAMSFILTIIKIISLLLLNKKMLPI